MFASVSTVAGLYRFGEWLPIVRTLPGAPGTVIYRGERLGRALGLSRLWIAFSGYWPERGADFPTGTVKDLEAYTVLGRLPDRCGPLVVASAGNTASAFGAANYIGLMAGALFAVLLALSNNWSLRALGTARAIRAVAAARA